MTCANAAYLQVVVQSSQGWTGPRRDVKDIWKGARGGRHSEDLLGLIRERGTPPSLGTSFWSSILVFKHFKRPGKNGAAWSEQWIVYVYFKVLCCCSDKEFSTYLENPRLIQGDNTAPNL